MVRGQRTLASALPRKVWPEQALESAFEQALCRCQETKLDNQDGVVRSDCGVKVTPQEVKSFPSAAAFREWLARCHNQTDGIWLRFFKQNAGEKSLTHAAALDEALCYGWIDGQAKGYDERSWLQRFSPRRSASVWSKRNTQHVERLIKAGKMAPAGLKEAEAAKADGRWQAAYDSPRNASPPADFLAALEENQEAKAFFASLNKTNVYSIVYRLQTAKRTETPKKRLRMILEMLSRGEKFHS